MSSVLIQRDMQPKQTLGTLIARDRSGLFTCKTLELPWLDNKRQVSCIPDWEYELVKHVSPTWGNCLKVMDVPNRSDILIHPGNYAG